MTFEFWVSMSSETEKYDQLRQKMLTFRSLLIGNDVNDPRPCQLLEEVLPLFLEIEAGCNVPPQEGLFEQTFQGEGTTYSYPHPIYVAAAESRGALEDWPSKPWWPVVHPSSQS